MCFADFKQDMNIKYDIWYEKAMFGQIIHVYRCLCITYTK